jgi:hypothetical protein
MLAYSCTAMHMWIRAMEFLFNLSIKLQEEGKKQKSSPFTSEECKLAKQRIQVRCSVSRTILRIVSVLGSDPDV